MGIKINNTKAEVKNVISSSDLSDEKKDMWHVFLSAIPEESVLAIAEALREDKSILSFLTENIEKKIIAVQSNNKGNWKKIIEDEKNFLEDR